MASVSNSLRQIRCQRQVLGSQLLPIARPKYHMPLAIRTLKTDANSSSTAPETSNNDASNTQAVVESVQLPFRGVSHVRAVPATPSYFTRSPQINDMYIRVCNLLTKYHHLPTVPANEAPPMAWSKLDEMRSQVGEAIKASFYTKVMKVAKRLNLIEPSLRPTEVKIALEQFVRDIDPLSNMPSPVIIDKFGRAVGVGKRKASTARAFVVEGTGEILVNGKPLNEAFGRVHDRESAVWALTSTARLDKYNVWALVEGGGTTGQAEALTLGIAKALVAHEPALKPALRKGKSNENSLLFICYCESTANVHHSWMYHKRSQNRGTQEARSPQGSQVPCLGQAIKALFVTATHQLPITDPATQKRSRGPGAAGHEGGKREDTRYPRYYLYHQQQPGICILLFFCNLSQMYLPQTNVPIQYLLPKNKPPNQTITHTT